MTFKRKQSSTLSIFVFFFLFLFHFPPEKNENLRMSNHTKASSAAVSKYSAEANFTTHNPIITNESIPILIKMPKEDNYDLNARGFNFKNSKDDKILRRMHIRALAQDRIRQNNSNYQNNIYLEYAEKVANWLKSQAVEVSPGAYKWPLSEEEPEYCPVGMGSGAAGIGTFYLELYKIIKNPEYLKYAE